VIYILRREKVASLQFFILIFSVGGSNLKILKCVSPVDQGGRVVLGTCLKSPLGWILKTLKGGRVVLIQVGVCYSVGASFQLTADKTRALGHPSSGS